VNNVGCDLLFRLVGGPGVVNAYIHRIGVEEIILSLRRCKWLPTGNVQYQNWSTPFAMKLGYAKILYRPGIILHQHKIYYYNG